MNGNYYPNPTFPTIEENTNFITPPNNVNYVSTLPIEQSYIENILRQNKGKRVNAYVSYPDSSSWQNKVYRQELRTYP